jgi:type II secretory pathway component GspD/PulD (secretin)
MNSKRKIGLLSVLVCLSAASPSLAQNKDDDFYQPWVDYRNGEISVAFDRTPVQFALQAFHAKTGFQIIIPSSAETKFVNLRLARQQLEPAVRSIISNIGYSNFALMYDKGGRPNRAVVLGAQVETLKSAPAQTPDSPVAHLTPEERDKLMKELERWSDLNKEERGRIEDRLKSLPASDDRDQLVRAYGQQVLGLTQDVIAAKN